MRFVKRVNDRGVLTLPNEVRSVLGVEDGDIVEFEVLGIVHKAKTAKTGSNSNRGLVGAEGNA